MTIPCNKNITKLLNSYIIGITITLQSIKHTLNFLLTTLEKILRAIMDLIQGWPSQINELDGN